MTLPTSISWRGDSETGQRGGCQGTQRSKENRTVSPIVMPRSEIEARWPRCKRAGQSAISVSGPLPIAGAPRQMNVSE